MYGIVIAFKDYSIFRGVAGSDWVGFSVFERAFEQPSFWRAFVNTIRLNLLSLIFGFPAPIVFALLLNEIRRRNFKKIVQSVSYLPHFFSWVVVYGILLAFLNPYSGLLSGLLEDLGLEPIPFLADISWWLSVYVGSGIWKGAGWAAIIYIAALSAIDPDLYDAAYVRRCRLPALHLARHPAGDQADHRDHLRDQPGTAPQHRVRAAVSARQSAGE